MKILNGLLVAAMLLLPTTALSGTIYNNTVLSGPATGLTGSDRTIQIGVWPAGTGSWHRATSSRVPAPKEGVAHGRSQGRREAGRRF